MATCIVCADADNQQELDQESSVEVEEEPKSKPVVKNVTPMEAMDDSSGDLRQGNAAMIVSRGIDQASSREGSNILTSLSLEQQLSGTHISRPNAVRQLLPGSSSPATSDTRDVRYPFPANDNKEPLGLPHRTAYQSANLKPVAAETSSPHENEDIMDVAGPPNQLTSGNPSTRSTSVKHAGDDSSTQVKHVDSDYESSTSVKHVDDDSSTQVKHVDNDNESSTSVKHVGDYSSTQLKHKDDSGVFECSFCEFLYTYRV
jgi:hypothetical protein